MQFELLKLLATDAAAMGAAERLRRAEAAGRVHAQAELCAAAGGRAAPPGRERRAAAAGEAGRGPRKKSAARRVKDAEKLRTSWVRKRCDAAVAASVGGVKLGRVLACVGTFILHPTPARGQARCFAHATSAASWLLQTDRRQTEFWTHQLWVHRRRYRLCVTRTSTEIAF